MDGERLTFCAKSGLVARAANIGCLASFGQWPAAPAVEDDGAPEVAVFCWGPFGRCCQVA